MLVMMAFMQTLFPEPVDPAIRKCGMSSRFAIIGFPDKSRPMASVKSEDDSWNCSSSMSSFKYMTFFSVFGTSMPSRDFPGTAATLTISTFIERAMSAARFSTCETLTPVASSRSKREMTGPSTTFTISASMPKSASVFFRRSASPA